MVSESSGPRHIPLRWERTSNTRDPAATQRNGWHGLPFLSIAPYAGEPMSVGDATEGEDIVKILVALKRVADPDNANKVRIVAGGERVDTGNLEWKLNPFDEYALEAA